MRSAIHFIKKTGITALLLPLVLSLSACSGASPALKAEQPIAELFRAELKKEISSLNVPIETSTVELGKTLNQSIRKEIYKGSTKTRGLTADIIRNGTIVVTAADNFLHFTVPIIMNLSYGMFETPSIPFALKFRASASITPDWRVNTEIYYLGLSDLLADETRIGPLTLKPRSIMEGVTQPVQKLLSELISKKINEMFPLKSQIAKVWSAAHKPLLLDRNYNAWLKLTPLEVMLSPLYAHNNRVKLGVGINAYAEMVIGPEPITPTPRPLPELQLVSRFDKSFRIALNTDLFYRDILSIASPLLLNKEFVSDGRKVVIKAFDLYGNGEKLVVRVETSGSLDGVIYLTGKPLFNPQTNNFSVEEVDFDIQTQDLLLKSAGWLLQGTIREKIQEALNMNMTRQLEQSREMAQKAIARIQLVDNVMLKGSIKTLKFSDALVQKEKISIQVYTEGESVIYFE